MGFSYGTRSMKKNRWLIISTMLVVVAIAITWATVFQRPPTEREEVFDLAAVGSSHIIIGKVEVILKLESRSTKSAIITCSVDGEATTEEYHVGDVIVELPKGKIVFEHLTIIEWMPMAFLG